MANTEPLLDLLRTNSVSNYLVRRTQNKYVAALRELLQELGYGKELKWDKLGATPFYGEETAAAVRSFAARNGMSGDGYAVSPDLVVRMIQRNDGVEGVQMLQRALANRQLSQAFNLADPNNFGTQQLKVLLEILGHYDESTPEALKAFARKKGIYAADREISESLGRALLQDLRAGYGEGFQLDIITPTPSPNPTPRPSDPVATLPTTPVKDLRVVESATNVTVSDGAVQIQFKKHAPLGVSTFGFHTLENFVNTHNQELLELDLTPSAMAVIKAVAQNEGRLDGINTYDRGFVSIGVFQWSLGRDERGGELPALLKKIKSYFPATFQQYFTAYGLDVSDDTNTTYGYIAYNNNLVNAPFLKDQFRDPSWAFRFWRAAQEANVQAVQVEHAISRLKNFYWKHTAMGHLLSQLITSSYGVALLLDNHVNRPAWVAPCVEQAMIRSGLTTDPTAWTDQEESLLIQTYLAVREIYSDGALAPMTASRKRADDIYSRVRQGTLSDRRGSFQVSNMALRAYDGFAFRSAEVKNEAAPPPFYAAQDYPDIEMDIEE